MRAHVSLRERSGGREEVGWDNFFFIEEGEWNKSFIFSFLLCSQRGEDGGAVP